MSTTAGEEYIYQWLDKNIDANILDTDFMTGFIEATKAKHAAQIIGAPTCPLAGRTLSRMYKHKKLSRFAIGIGQNWLPGFPKWVYSYELITNSR